MTCAPPVLLNVARPAGELDPVAVATAAGRAGLDGVGLADSPRLFPDPLVETERVLAGTEVRTAGPCVLSLGLRHPATVAGALRTLARHHPGRVLAVVGRGESSVRNEGLPVPSLRDHVAALRALDRLLADADRPHLLGAASGPRTIATTAAVLGGVLVDAGARPEVVARAVALARTERPDVEVWLFLRAVVTAGEEQAVAAAAPLLGSCAARMAAAPHWYAVRDDELPGVRAVADAHDYTRHGSAPVGGVTDGAVPAQALVREAFFVTGAGDDVARRVAGLAAGVSGVVLAGALDGVLDRLDPLARAVRRGLSAAG